MKNAEIILNILLDRYESSKLSKEGSRRNTKIRFVMERDMPDYFRIENYNKARALDEALDEYAAGNYIKLIKSDGLIECVELDVPRALQLSELLHRKLRSIHDEELRMQLAEYRDRGIDTYIDRIIDRLDNYKSVSSLCFDDAARQELLLKTLAAVINLNEDTYERVFSAKVLGNSKAFERIRSKVIHILKQFYSDEEEDEHVLAQFHVLKNPGLIMIKGHGSITIGTSLLRLEDFPDGITLTSSDLEAVREMNLDDASVMTIENLTSFYKSEYSDTLMIYLGGYHNSVRRNFLMRLYGLYPNKKYLHFGDIDAGGFYILEHLKAKTGIPFKAYKMGVCELKSFSKNTISLTVNDRERLKKLAGLPEYADVISYMLEHNIKLEQENVD